MAEPIECFCTAGRPCTRPLNGEDLLCKVCRRGCEPLIYIDAPAGQITTWDHQNSDTIGVMTIELEFGRVPPGGWTQTIPTSAG